MAYPSSTIALRQHCPSFLLRRVGLIETLLRPRTIDVNLLPSSRGKYEILTLIDSVNSDCCQNCSFQNKNKTKRNALALKGITIRMIVLQRFGNVSTFSGKGQTNTGTLSVLCRVGTVDLGFSASFDHVSVYPHLSELGSTSSHEF